MSIINQKNKGSITVFTGPMFSGKTTALIKEYNQLKHNKSILVLKPSIDNRYKENQIVSHNKDEINAVNIDNIEDVYDLIQSAEYIFIDEAQFLPFNTSEVLLKWKSKGKTFVISGLNIDYLAKPFGDMPNIMNIADDLIYCQGNCEKCNKPSTHTFRKNTNTELILIGEKTAYAGLCKNCFLENTKHYAQTS